MSPLNGAVDNRVDVQNVQPPVAVQIAFAAHRAFGDDFGILVKKD